MKSNTSTANSLTTIGAFIAALLMFVVIVMRWLAPMVSEVLLTAIGILP